jgi:hypothetical protein
VDSAALDSAPGAVFQQTEIKITVNQDLFALSQKPMRKPSIKFSCCERTELELVRSLTMFFGLL